MPTFNAGNPLAGVLKVIYTETPLAAIVVSSNLPSNAISQDDIVDT
jgi:hypothetical protein